jgi:hypothetical protein
MADEEAPKEVKRDPDDILKDWFKARVVSSFKCKPEAADALVNNEASRVAVETFLNSETCQRLLVFSNPDLMAVRAAPCLFCLLTRSRSPPRVGDGPIVVRPHRLRSVRDRATACFIFGLVLRRASSRVRLVRDRT